MSFYDDDAAVFLSDYGVPVTTVLGSTFTAIFDREASRQPEEYGGLVASSRCSITARTVDVSSLQVNEPLIISGTTYYVADVPRHDGYGHSTVELSRDPLR